MNVGKSTEPYSYLPLKDGEIRLLELLPSNEFADPIYVAFTMFQPTVSPRTMLSRMHGAPM